VLPSFSTLSVLLAISNILLLAPLVALDRLPVAVALGIFIVILVTSGVITYVIRALDQDSIVSLRRIFGLTLTSNLLWTIPLAVGSAFSWIQHNRQPGLNEFVVGTFLAWSFELLVINGAFISSTARSLCIAAVQPALTLLLASAFIIRLNSSVIYAAVLGFVILGITTAFLLKFKTFKTKGVGINSLQTFQSFLKSWVSQKPADLERYFTMYSHDEPVATSIVLATAAERVALVLPGVHPGPFFPVGSYNVSELIFHELRKNGITPMVLHGVGGHERNLPTNELAKRYATAIASVVSSPGAGRRVERMRGPSRLQLGPTCVTTLGFGNQVIAFLSNAPYNTDDLEPGIIDKAVSSAKELGVELMLVDAHNSIGGENCEQPNVDWKRVFSDIRGSPEEEFEVGMAHSSELQFEHGSDISDGGITALVFRKQESVHALISSDSNNAVLGLRQTIIDELKKESVDLIELCTSDTHNSAARSLTSRGYHALGEDTSRDTLVATIKRLEKLAEGRLSRGEVTTITSELTLPLIGDKSIADFATLTKETLSFTKAYASAALASGLVICSLALFL
jgi:putative membrane protein